MRILLVNEKRGYFGGVEQNIADTVRALRKRGHDCQLAYGSDARDAEDYGRLFSAVFSCRELATSDDDQQPSAEMLSFSSILKCCNPDTIYLHKTADTAFLKPFLENYRTVRMIHDHDLCCPRRHKYFALSAKVCHRPAGWRCWLDGAFIARSNNGLQWVSIGKKINEMKRNHDIDSLLVGSRFMQDELLTNGFAADQVHIVPPAVNFGETSITSPALPDNRNILYVGQLIRGKGVDLLLKALAQTQEEFKLTIAGTGNAREQLQSLAIELGIADRVEFTGWIAHDDLAAHFSSARVVVVPSRWPEPFGMVGLEAMRYARPLIGFDVGGIPDWLEDGRNGFLVDEQDTDAMCHALSRLLNDYELAAKMGRSGFEIAHQHFAFSDYISTMEKHLSGNIQHSGQQHSGTGIAAATKHTGDRAS